MARPPGRILQWETPAPVLTPLGDGVTERRVRPGTARDGGGTDCAASTVQLRSWRLVSPLSTCPLLSPG